MIETKMRLIDADALLFVLGNEYFPAKGEFARAMSIARFAIQDAPTIDATVFPCKIGDPVWFVGTNNVNRLKAGVIETTVEKLVLKSGGIYMKLACNAMYETSCRSIGKTVFFSLEEAEAALAKYRKDDVE